MQTKFYISDMHCQSCVKKISEALLGHPSIDQVTIHLDDESADISTSKNIDIQELSSLFENHQFTYKIYHYTDKASCKEQQPSPVTYSPVNNSGKAFYYCPMHCEENKTYDNAGDCPVCGMDLLEQASLIQHTQYTCPHHAEIIQDNPGRCAICNKDLVIKKTEISSEEKAYQALLLKMKISVFFALPVFILSMSEMLKNNPFEAILPLPVWHWIQLLLTLPIVFYTCSNFYVRAWRSIISRQLNMFTLVGIGTGVAFTFSLVGLFFPELFPNEFKNDQGQVHLYFEATAVILSLVLLGQLLEAKAHSKTSSALKSLLDLSPTEAIRIETNASGNAKDVRVSVQSIIVGDLLRILPGAKIPVDGFLYEGQATIDEAMITGEPIPVTKQVNDTINSGTINGNSSFIMQASKVGSDTLLAHIIHMVNDASQSRAPIQSLADRIARYFVPSVVITSLITFITWTLLGPEPAMVYGFANAIAVLIIACPCALGLATPMSIMVGIGKGAQSGILIKNAEVLETMNTIDVLITDKTGTLTVGKPSLKQLVSHNSLYSHQTLLSFCTSISKHSDHPLSKAIVTYGEEKQAPLFDVDNFQQLTGMGVCAEIHGNDEQKLNIAIVNQTYLEQQNIQVSESIESDIRSAQSQGHTVSYVVINQQVVAHTVIFDEIKASSAKVVKALQQRGIRLIMATGDNALSAQSVSKTLGFDECIAQCLPQDKLAKVKELQAQGKVVAMVGDGINDAPALAQANIGIAMGTGTDIAMESAEITLVSGNLEGIIKAMNLSRGVIRNIKQNLFFAFIFNTLGVPIAAGILFPFFGILLSPMIAALAMSLSSVSVISNSLRLKNLPL